MIAAVIDIESWLSTGGLALLAAIVFAETGLLVGFFLPGDSLLFMAGFLSSAAGGHVLPPLPITALVVFIAAVAGDQVGYLIGLRIGPSLFSRPGSRLFNPLNAVRAQAFFDRRGPVGARARPVRPDRANLRPRHRRCREDALPHVPDLQRDRRRHLGHRRHHARLLPRRDRDREAQPGVGGGRDRGHLVDPGRHRVLPIPARARRTRRIRRRDRY